MMTLVVLGAVSALVGPVSMPVARPAVARCLGPALAAEPNGNPEKNAYDDPRLNRGWRNLLPTPRNAALILAIGAGAGLLGDDNWLGRSLRSPLVRVADTEQKLDDAGTPYDEVVPGGPTSGLALLIGLNAIRFLGERRRRRDADPDTDGPGE